MQVGGVSLDLTLIMHEHAFGDYLTDHYFLSLEMWAGEQATRDLLKALGEFSPFKNFSMPGNIKFDFHGFPSFPGRAGT